MIYPLQVVFILVSAVTLGAALMVVTTRNMVRAALWLVLALFGVAILFVLLEAGFFAVAQVIIYIGAIAILMIFAVMLTRRIAQDPGPQLNSTWPIAAVIALLVFGLIVFLVQVWDRAASLPPPLPQGFAPLQELGVALVSADRYLIPFEIASVLLLAALIGAIVVAWERK
ncbi:MAG: NADH-quinone oxidoreductase subunit J [Anaerolineales bacterium]|nr:NADH-quinone oxidoreductase subunit J [Anaerolineales bacterium]MCS7246761.1 NADH-quinone oxidoreductase subunit J [Anaerolineales bacterium]MDW8160571.1 NADH-quinone oxidoreductase subunit J [Anaerolineales bacterium]MDW8447108.1 NADH-quinone oxidoreductase subunit J [Anaerolineales bacterium]